SQTPSASRAARGWSSRGRSDDSGAMASRGAPPGADAPRRSAIGWVARRAGRRPSRDLAARRRPRRQRCRHPARLVAGARSRRRADRDPPRRGAAAREIPCRRLRSGRLADPDRAPGPAAALGDRRRAPLRAGSRRNRQGDLAPFAAPLARALRPAGRRALVAALRDRTAGPVLLREGALRALARAARVCVATLGRGDAFGGTAPSMGTAPRIAPPRNEGRLHHPRRGSLLDGRPGAGFGLAAAGALRGPAD